MEQMNELRAGVKCDACGCAFGPELLTRREGEIEYTWFCCDYCGRAYMVSVTDEALRRNIKKYAAIAEKGRHKRLTEKEIRKTRRLLEANMKRADELRRQYFRGEKDGYEERSGIEGDEYLSEGS